MSTDLIQLIYVSSARGLLPENELLNILEVSRRKNAERDITGILLYKGGNFLQVLEGPEDAVTALYTTISRDTRHDGLLLIAQRPIAARDFPDWTMGFVDLETVDPDSIPGYSAILKEPFNGATFAARPSLAYHFIKVFKENMR